MRVKFVGIDFYSLKQRALSMNIESAETLVSLVMMVLFTVQPREYVVYALDVLRANIALFQTIQGINRETLLMRLVVLEKSSPFQEMQVRIYEGALRHYIGYLIENPKTCLRTIERYLSYLPPQTFEPYQHPRFARPPKPVIKEKGIRNKMTHWLKTYNDILATARYLAVRESFQISLEKFRSKYGIVHGFPGMSSREKGLQVASMGYESPEDVLATYTKASSTSIAQVLMEIREKLCDPHPDLKWKLHSGLIVAAVCFGLDENQLKEATGDWRLMWALGRQFRYTFGTSYDLDFDYREPFLDAVGSLAYMVSLLNLEQLESMPAFVKDSLDYASKYMARTNTQMRDNTPQDQPVSNLSTSGKSISCYPVVRINRSTRLDTDVPVIWPIIESMREAFLGNPARGLVWLHYRRDLFLEAAVKAYAERGKQVDWDEIYELYIQEHSLGDRRDKGLKGNHLLKTNKLVKAVANLKKRRKLGKTK